MERQTATQPMTSAARPTPISLKLDLKPGISRGPSPEWNWCEHASPRRSGGPRPPAASLLRLTVDQISRRRLMFDVK